MGFDVTIKNHILRELTSPGEDGKPRATEKEDVSGYYEGKVTVRRGLVTLSFSEPDGSLCSVTFPKDEPTIVTLSQRFGIVSDSMTMVLEEGRRHISLNRVLFDNVEVTTVCHKLSNNLLSTGKLRLSYSIEIHGFRMEKVSMSLEMHKNN